MYAITGITGKVGGQVANALLARGAKVRAVARDADKASRWTERGCELAVAEIHDRAALTRAFAGTEGVFIVIPPIYDPTQGFPEAREIIATVRGALEDTKPGKVVCLSTVGAQVTRENLLNQLGIMEKEIGSLDRPTAFLRAAWFMENAALDVESARQCSIHSFRQPADLAIPMIATADIGAEGARLLGEDWTGSRIVELQGELVAPIDLARSFSTVLGHPVEVQAVPRDQWEKIFRDNGMHNPVPRMQMIDGFNGNWLAFEGGDSIETVTGQTSLEVVLRALVEQN